MSSPTLQLRFDPDQDYQIEAIRAVTDLFDGYARRDTSFRLRSEDIGREDVVANIPPDQALNEGWLRDNLAAMQRRNGIAIERPSNFDVDEGSVLDGAGSETWRYPSFTIEMETGTGKTYVYLRTIYELRRLYGFGKFVIVVPSIAIYEGVVKTFDITRAHFASLYANERINLIRYDGSQLSRLRSFATSTSADVLVITLDAFNKVSNNLYKPTEKLPGERLPFQFIQGTRPILILDEPQNMESQIARRALRTLHPLFALRYSATHRTSPNLVYRLTPFEAYRRGLVKRIQVVGITQREDLNTAFLALRSITKTGPIRATVRTRALDGARSREVDVTLRQNEDLFARTKREEHRGYVVRDIHRGDEYVEFENGIRLDASAALGPSRPAIFKAQINETVRQHMEWQEELKGRGIKVLSLFFVDRVANYTAPDGIVRTLFDEAFRKHRVAYQDFRHIEPEQVREAYFAKTKVKGGEEAESDTEGRNAVEREAERRAFELIMKKKEQLLSFDEPISFIFAHSALKEGWDNPNVFQICTLNQTTSETKKRQEIGRGLRLCVDQRGERVPGDEVNVLTVIANESYQSYVSRLQNEYVEDGEAAPPAPTEPRKNIATRNDALFVGNADFDRFWDRLRRRIRYRIDLDSDALVADCVARLARQAFPDPRVIVQRGAFIVHKYKLTLRSTSRGRARIAIDITNTRDETTRVQREFSPGDDLADILNDQRLRHFVIAEVHGGPRPKTIFENAVELTPGQFYEFETSDGQRVSEAAVQLPEGRYAVFNLADRAARETGLTRSSINSVFNGLPASTKRRLISNPEGFAGVFIPVVRDAVADHVARSLEFEIDDGEQLFDLEELFPPTRRYPQKETIAANEYGLYDLIQKDSAVEETFVRRLKADPQVVVYFKFPPAFKVRLPRIIGNYNPDWGIIRRSDNGRLIFHLVRETKGTVDLDALQFPHERRKIISAAKYFGAVGVDYRTITGNTADWWMPSSGLASQEVVDG
ncbi:MAG TPA: DEAD/DEAH box helicase family protein [Gemmatimonadaceae bacterium]|jgi:type III restriction enzyme